MIHAGVHSTSFRQGQEDLKKLAEMDISEQRIARATKRIGQERVTEREAEKEAWEKLPLPEQQRGNPTEQVPEVACVEMDGGRIQIRDRKAAAETCKTNDNCWRKGRFWRESKVGCLLSMVSSESQQDPCPEIPEVFVNPARMSRISREIKGFGVEEEAAESDESKSQQSKSSKRPGQPEVLVRNVVATRENIDAFGKQLAAAAWQHGFAAAKRKAFVGDGMEANWTVWRKYFSHYTPILDFIHAICYVFAAAMAGRSMAEAWPIYCEWAQWIWSGQVEKVIAALQRRQQVLGPPGENEPEESPRQKVAEALRYLGNQKSRMRYDQYRRCGLPITSSHIESTIKQINRRVKGSEKFWSTGGAEALLQLAADHLSETDPLKRFWQHRQHHTTGHRHYCTAL